MVAVDGVVGVDDVGDLTEVADAAVVVGLEAVSVGCAGVEPVEVTGRVSAETPRLDWPTVGVAELEGTGFDGEAAFVEGVVMETADQDQVVELGKSAVGPVFDVVGVEPPDRGAARELAAAVVAVLEGLSDTVGHNPAVPTNR